VREPLSRTFVAALLTLAASTAPAFAQQRPLWEFGLGAIGLTLPDYRGANQNQEYLFPLPYFIYRGEYFRADREGIRGVFFDSDRVEVNLSLWATPPVKSDRNSARQGMPNLNPTVEIGPSLNLTLARDLKRECRLALRLPVRAAIATDISHTQSAGVVFYPNLNLDLRPEFLGGRWDLGLTAGPFWASRPYNEYFYGVPQQFATPERPAFTAAGGYSGATFIAGITRRFDKLWIGAYVRYDNLKGAVFDDSPLFKRDYSVAAGIGFAWVFAESDRKVVVDVPF